MEKRGFSLVEILVGLAILSLAITAFMILANHVAGLHAENRLRRGAAILAQGLMEELMAPEATDPEHQGEQGALKWTWEREDSDIAAVEKVIVQIEWQYRGRDRSYVLETYRPSGQVGP